MQTVNNESLASVFAALGDSTRLELVSRLAARRDSSIRELGEGLQLTRQAIRKHLQVLENADLVTGERVGREHRFRVSGTSLQPANRYLEGVASQWDDAAQRLKDYLESEDPMP